MRRLDWVAVDHFNTGHPHTHLVIRGRDRDGRELVMARDYIAYGIRARAQALVTLELGPETEIERLRKLTKEVDQERLTRLDRKIVGRAVDGILTVTAAHASDAQQQSLQIGRLQTSAGLALRPSCSRASGVSIRRLSRNCARSVSVPTPSR